MTMDFQGRTRLTIRPAYIATSPFRCATTIKFQPAMHLPSIKHRPEQGSTLLTVVVVGAIMCISASSMLVMSSNSLRNASGRVDWDKAFFISENALVWAAQAAFDTAPSTNSTNYYSTALGTLPLGKLISPSNGDATLKGAWVQVMQPSTLPSNVY